MEKDRKRCMRAAAVILITAFFAMTLPHLDQSIFEILIPPIKLSPGSRLYLAGLLPLILLLWSYCEIVKSKCFNHSKVTIFLIMFFILVPFTFRAMDAVKTPYYMLSSGLKSVEVTESKYSFPDTTDHTTLAVDLNLKNYGKEIKDFDVSFEVPESLENIIDEEIIELPKKYTIGDYQNTLPIHAFISFHYKEGYSEEDLFDTCYFYDDYRIILSKGNDVLTIEQRGK